MRKQNLENNLGLGEKPDLRFIERKKDKVAIVGYAPSSRNLAPYQDQDFEIWGVNELYKIAPRLDLLFELHQRQFLNSKERNPLHLKYLQESKIPIYMIKHFDDIPMSIEYPLDVILDLFGDYFTNSISFMIALAVLMGYKEIHIYGIDMATLEEYGSQKPSVEYFIGVARGRGIKVIIPAQSDLLKTQFMYGYQGEQLTQAQLKMKARKSELQERIQGYRKQAEDSISAMNQMIGALDDCQYWDRCWQPTNPNDPNENNLTT